MKKLQNILLSVIPKVSAVPLILAFSFNMAVYGGARMIAGDWHHYNIESFLDRMIPFVPMSAVIYLGCYLFWIVNYILIARQEKREVCQFFAADFLSRAVCFVIYLLFPTTNTRPVVEPDGFWNQVMLLIYEVDAADNLFPSIHCLVSWFCYIGVRGNAKIPAWYQNVSCLLALLVCVSTVTTKQHVLVDVFGGVLLAQICLWIGKKPLVWGFYEKVLDKINGRIFRKEA